MFDWLADHFSWGQLFVRALLICQKAFLVPKLRSSCPSTTKPITVQARAQKSLFQGNRDRNRGYKIQRECTRMCLAKHEILFIFETMSLCSLFSIFHTSQQYFHRRGEKQRSRSSQQQCRKDDLFLSTTAAAYDKRRRRYLRPVTSRRRLSFSPSRWRQTALKIEFPIARNSS